MKGRGGDHGRGGQHAKVDNAAVAKLLGMTEAELQTAEQAGKSLAAIAGEKGVAVQSVVDLIAKQLTASLDERLASGSLTQAEYDSAKADITTRASEMVNRAFNGKDGFGRGAGPGFGGRGGKGAIDESAIASLLGMTESDYETAEHAGKSMAALAEEKGVVLQSVIDLVTKQLTEALDKQLSDCKLTQAQYDTRKAGLANQVQKIVNDEHTGKDGLNGQRPAGGKGGKPAQSAATATTTTANR